MARTDITQHANAETRRKGAYASHKARTENAKTFRQLVREKLEARADEVADRWLAQGDDDWRAYQAFVAEGYGKPPQSVEVSGPDGAPIEVNLDGDPSRLSRVAALLAEAQTGGTPEAADAPPDPVHPAPAD